VEDKTTLVGRSLGDGRYEIIELYGRGAFAEVYRGRQVSLNRDVAIKVLNEIASRDETLVKRFHHEAATVARFDHPNIVKIYDHGEEGNLHYYVMNFLPRNLRSLLRPKLPLMMETVLQIAHQLASALDYAQTKVRNFVHRDLKPENVMFDQRHNAVLSDFGLVRGDQISRLTVGNNVIGTPAYMSPEQIRGLSLDPRSDLYALGVLLYECATGTAPFKGEIMSVCHHHLHDPPPAPRSINPGLPAELEKVILRLLEKEPERRYQSAGELATALEDLLPRPPQHKTSVYAQPTVPVARIAEPRQPEATATADQPEAEKPPSSYQPRRASLWPYYLLVGVLAVTLAGAIFFHYRGKRVSSQAERQLAGANVRVPAIQSEPVAPVFGTLELSSRPPGARIFINSAEQNSKTPARLDSLPPAQYAVRLILSGYESWHDSVNVAPGEVTRMAPVLTPVRPPVPATVPLTIVSDPAAEIFVDNKSYGLPADGALTVSVPAGLHRVECRLPGFSPQFREVVLTAGASAHTVRFVWFGEISVQASDENGFPVYGPVFLNNEATDRLSDGSTWNVPVGRYRVSVRKFGLVMVDEPPVVRIEGGDRHRVVIRMRKLE